MTCRTCIDVDEGEKSATQKKEISLKHDRNFSLLVQVESSVVLIFRLRAVHPEPRDLFSIDINAICCGSPLVSMSYKGVLSNMEQTINGFSYERQIIFMFVIY